MNGPRRREKACLSGDSPHKSETLDAAKNGPQRERKNEVQQKDPALRLRALIKICKKSISKLRECNNIHWIKYCNELEYGIKKRNFKN